MRLLCIDVGGTYIKHAVYDGGNRLEQTGKIPTPADTLDHLLEAIQGLYLAAGNIDGIALCLPGIIDTEKGFMKTGGSLPYIVNVPAAELVSKACGSLPVSIENDAKAAAIAELDAGALKNCRNAVVITVGTALGGTVVINRKPLRGSNLFAGEFSYLIYDADGTISAENKRQKLWGSHGVPSQMCDFYGDKNISAEEIMERLKRGDAKAEEAVRKSARQLAVLIYNLQCIIDSEMTAIGGGISAQEVYIDILKQEAEKLSAVLGPAPKIVACRFGNNANILGAYYAFMRKYGNSVHIIETVEEEPCTNRFFLKSKSAL